MRFEFDASWVDIGGYVACYQAAGVSTNFLTIFIPKTTHFVGTSLGLIGSIVVLVSSDYNKLAVIMGTIAVGFSESFSSAQLLLKNLACVNKDIELMSRKLKIQYASGELKMMEVNIIYDHSCLIFVATIISTSFRMLTVLLGMTSAYFLGGTVYDSYGINGVAIVEIIAGSFELLSLFLYVLLDKLFPDAPELDKDSPNANDENNDVNSHIQNEEVSEEDSKSKAQDPPHPRGRRGSVFGRASVYMRGSIFKRGSIMDRIFQFSSNEIKPALDSFGTSDIGANFINYVFVSEYHSICEGCLHVLGHFWSPYSSYHHNIMPSPLIHSHIRCPMCHNWIQLRHYSNFHGRRVRH